MFGELEFSGGAGGLRLLCNVNGSTGSFDS